MTHLATDPKPITSSERRTYFFDPSPFGGATPSGVTMYVIDLTTGVDVTSTTTTGSISAAATTFPYKSLGGLTSGHLYRVGLKFTVGGNDYDEWFYQACSDQT